MNSGVRLGVYQGAALVAPISFMVLFATDHPVLAATQAVTAGIGWLGWWRDFRFARTIH